MSADRLTIPESIRKLFGIDVAKESPLLKTKANSMVRNGLIQTETELIVHRKAVYLAEGQDTVLFNALVLNAFFPDPKDVKKVFHDDDYRLQAAAIVKSVLLDTQSVIGVAVSNPKSLELISCLESSFDLFSGRLPNPFQILPQVALEDNISLLHALLAQSASLSLADGLLLSYLNGDIVEANRLAQLIEHDTPELTALKNSVESKLREAEEFDSLLDQFREM
ncbi:MAG: hypothetical protein ACPGF7_08925 [Pontibacterium sp.]